jgi:hypothetical protein
MEHIEEDGHEIINIQEMIDNIIINIPNIQNVNIRYDTPPPMEPVDIQNPPNAPLRRPRYRTVSNIRPIRLFGNEQ